MSPRSWVTVGEDAGDKSNIAQSGGQFTHDIYAKLSAYAERFDYEPSMKTELSAYEGQGVPVRVCVNVRTGIRELRSIVT